jgi:hypothetical protein
LTPPPLLKRIPGTGKGFFSQLELDQILAPLPEEIQRFFDGEE